MAESKRTFQAAKMNKDIDDRLLQPGTYRDALNVSVEFSEDGNVGALENLKGNEILSGQDILGLSSSSNPNAAVIGSYAHPEESKIYYFVTGDKTDGIFEYDISDPNNPVVSTIIVDSTEENLIEEVIFAFSDAGVSATIAQNGKISLTSNLGSVMAVTEDFESNTSGSTKTLNIQAKVRVPQGYANSGEFVFGIVSATQISQTAPSSVETKTAINVTQTSAKLRGALGYDDVGVTATGFYWGYNTGGTALTISELENGGSGITRNTVNISSSDSDFSSTISSLPSDKLISFAAFATNPVGTGEGAVKTFTTSEVPAINRPPNNKLFIVPAIAYDVDDPEPPETTFPFEGEAGPDGRNVGYGDWEKADNNFYFVVFSSSSSGQYSDQSSVYGSGSPLVSISSNPSLSIVDGGGVTKEAGHYILGSGVSDGIYNITATLSGHTSNSIQIVQGSAGVSTYKATFVLNFAKTGVGTLPALGQGDSSQYQYNVSPNTPATFSIGPYSQGLGKGAIVVPISTDNSGAFGSFSGFDATKLDVSMTDTNSLLVTDFDYYICDTGPAIFGTCPAVIIEADPYILNNGSSNASYTLNITYNY